MIHTKFWTVLLLIVVICKVEGQVYNRDFDLENFVENLFNLQEANVNYEDLYEQFLLLYENPINLNNADRNRLQLLFILSNQQIDSIIEYRENNGKLLSPFELLYIKGITPDLFTNLQPFISVDSNDFNSDSRPLLERILSERNNYVIMRYERSLEAKRGYKVEENEESPPYAGSPDKIYLRYRASKSGDFSIGFTTEKDAGEAITWNSNRKQYAMDFWSGHVMLEKLHKVTKVIIGDYQLQLGQGLLFGGGFGAGKGSETINALERTHLGIRPYTSVIEGGFLRGAAVNFELNTNLNLTGFLSRLRQDANIREGDVDNDFEQFFSSIQLLGLHRTKNELSNRRQIRESVYGLNLNYKPDELKQVGIILTANRFGLPIQRSNQPYNKFEFSGTQNLNASVYGNIKLKEFRFFGEAAMSKSGGTGALLGFTTTLSPRIDFAMIARNYTQDFHSFRGSAFGEGSRNINERGVYWGLKYRFNSQFYLTAYYDSFRFPWLRFRVNSPSEGNDYLVRLNYVPRRRVSMYLQYRKRNREENSSEVINNSVLVQNGTRQQVLANFQFRATPTLSLKSRVQYSKFGLGAEKTDGFAIIQDAVLDIGNLTISGRMAIFDTKGQENRQYAYERDVLYAFSIPAYYGRGIRNYILFAYPLNRKIDCWFRIARTTFYDRDEIGAGHETIDGNKRTDVKFQLRYKLN